MRPADSDIIGTDPRTAAPDFGLFAQRIASPEAARPVARIEMPGASQAAREAIAPHLTKLQARVLRGVVGHGPITRDDLARVLGMNPNTLRPRVKELLTLERIHVLGYTMAPRRELLAVLTPNERALHGLLAVTPTHESETDR